MDTGKSQVPTRPNAGARSMPAARTVLCLLLLAGTALAEQPKTVTQSLDDAGSSTGKSVAETASCWLVDVPW